MKLTMSSTKLLRTLYALRLPGTFLGLIVYIANICILYSGPENLAVRVIFGIIGYLLLASELIYTVYITYSIWNLNGKSTAARDLLFALNGLEPAFDTFIGLALGWGMAAFSLWIFDTSIDHDKYWEPVFQTENNWVVGFQFMIAAIDPMTATSPFSFVPKHILSLVLVQAISVFHHFYTILFISVFSAALYEKVRLQRKAAASKNAKSESSPEKEPLVSKDGNQNNSNENPSSNSTMNFSYPKSRTPFTTSVQTSMSGKATVIYDSQGRVIGLDEFP